MSTFEWTTIVAILVAPLLAIQTQKAIEAAREKRARRRRVFFSLMGTRAAQTSPEHVQALNMIDLEFYGLRFFGLRYQGRLEKSVVDAWREYRDHLNNHPRTDAADNEHSEAPEDRLTPVLVRAWNDKANTLFVNLLHSLSRCLGYDFDRVELEKGAYSPQAHLKQFLDQHAVRSWVLELIEGKTTLPISVPMGDEEVHENRLLRRALTQLLERCDRIDFRPPPLRTPNDPLKED